MTFCYEYISIVKSAFIGFSNKIWQFFTHFCDFFECHSEEFSNDVSSLVFISEKNNKTAATRFSKILLPINSSQVLQNAIWTTSTVFFWVSFSALNMRPCRWATQQQQHLTTEIALSKFIILIHIYILKCVGYCRKSWHRPLWLRLIYKNTFNRLSLFIIMWLLGPVRHVQVCQSSSETVPMLSVASIIDDGA